MNFVLGHFYPMPHARCVHAFCTSKRYTQERIKILVFCLQHLEQLRQQENVFVFNFLCYPSRAFLSSLGFFSSSWAHRHLECYIFSSLQHFTVNLKYFYLVFNQVFICLSGCFRSLSAPARPCWPNRSRVTNIIGKNHRSKSQVK